MTSFSHDKHVEARPPLRAVIFDVFGTLAKIGDKRWPFARLARSTADPRSAMQLMMTTPLDLHDAAEQLDCSGADMARLTKELAAELASVTLFPDAIDAIRAVRNQGVMVGIASNLAAPYATPVMQLLPFQLDAYGWSYEIGHLKPHPEHFAWVCRQLQVEPEQALMVGDTLTSDFEGARVCGLQAVHLDREGRCHRPDVPTVQTLHQIVALL